jgi:hypothetical protein
MIAAARSEIRTMPSILLAPAESQSCVPNGTQLVGAPTDLPKGPNGLGQKRPVMKNPVRNGVPNGVAGFYLVEGR